MATLNSKLTTATVLAAFLVTPVQAIDGNDLHRWCSGKHPRNVGNCDGYIIGVSEATQLFEAAAAVFCVPDRVMNQQIIDTTKKYLADHPERRHEVAAALIVDALVAGFPCKGVK
jgi:hypothetical protein